MTTPTIHLPGKLGNPERTLATDPRLDPAVLPAVAGMDEVLDQPAAIGPDSSYEELLAYAAAMEAEIDAVYAETFGAVPPVEGVRRRTEVIAGGRRQRHPALHPRTGGPRRRPAGHRPHPRRWHGDVRGGGSPVRALA